MSTPARDAAAGAARPSTPTRLEVGLSAAEATARLERDGPNELPSPPADPVWRRALIALSDRMVLVLLAAAVVAYAVGRDLKTPVVIVIVVLLNVVLGLIQEGRADRALEALRAMTSDRTRVRRDGHSLDLAASEVVVGDVMLLEAGDRIAADGVLRAAHTLEVDESALTGESTPVAKVVDAEVAPDAPLGDRLGDVFMHTAVTRGRAEVEVTATGTGTQIGRIATMLGAGRADATPLEQQLHRLAGRLAMLAGTVVALVMILGLIRGTSFSEVFEGAVALAVAAIPEGLPAVTAVTLALGVQRMARRNAILKRLAAVETLGSATVICSDKTGTLTRNQMTATTVVHADAVYTADPAGYVELPPHLDHVGNAAVLCNDATAHNGHVTGDPTELALLPLIGGRDLGEIRRAMPRRAELPFESATKFMATLHQPDLLVVKGAFDVLVPRCTRLDVSTADAPDSSDDLAGHCDALQVHHDQMAADGMRVLALAARRVPAGISAAPDRDELAGLVEDLTLVALIGIIDPVRPEARDAIETARTAGISVRMITGDHAITAAAIGRTLGLDGDVLTGADLDQLDDRTLADRLDSISVYARVSPEHKLRLVEAFKARDDVVAMTGDGVNDAPALRRADIGVAMGITGTDVSKQAADMVLVDDDFTTIVDAVEEGRTIHGAVVHFIRFQLSTSIGFAVLFLLTATFGIGTGVPFSAVAILWVNLLLDGPPAMTLGADPPEADVMRRSPRPRGEQILVPERTAAIALGAVVMALGTLAVLVLGPDDAVRDGDVSTATAMAFTTFVLFQVFNLLNCRSDHGTVFQRRTFTNRWLWIALAAVMAAHVAIINVGPAQRFMELRSITLPQWAICIAVASSVVWVDELRKLVLRRGRARYARVQRRRPSASIA